MEMYEHYLIYGHLEFLFGGYRDKKKRIAFQPVDWIAYQSKDSLNLYFGKKEKKRKIELKLSYHLYIKKLYVLSAT